MRKLIAVLATLAALGAVTTVQPASDITAGDHPCMACW